MQKTKNFTLIELLVVISIIAILASMLLPALKVSRDVAIEKTCQNNFKQCTLGMMTYINDSGDIIPPYERDHRSDSGVYQMNNRGLVYPSQLPWLNGIKEYIDASELKVEGGLGQYIYTNVSAKTRKRIGCPSPKGSRGINVAESSISMPRMFIGGMYCAGKSLTKITQLRVPSKKALFVESPRTNQNSAYGIDSYGGINGFGWKVHPSGASLAYCDGHIVSMTKSTAMSIVYSESKSSAWNAHCYTYLFGYK